MIVGFVDLSPEWCGAVVCVSCVDVYTRGEGFPMGGADPIPFGDEAMTDRCASCGDCLVWSVRPGFDVVAWNARHRRAVAA